MYSSSDGPLCGVPASSLSGDRLVVVWPMTGLRTALLSHRLRFHFYLTRDGGCALGHAQSGDMLQQQDCFNICAPVGVDSCCRDTCSAKTDACLGDTVVHATTVRVMIVPKVRNSLYIYYYEQTVKRVVSSIHPGWPHPLGKLNGSSVEISSGAMR